MRTYLKGNASNFGTVLLSVILSFFPKCPFCWAAYMSIFSTFGLASIPYMPWLQPVMVVFFLVNIFTLFTVARKRKNYASFALSVTGASFLLGSTFMSVSLWLTYTGLLMIIAASLWNLFSKKLACDS
jgi:hypothetical protein